MSTHESHKFSSQIKELFSSGTVILFTCDSTNDFPLLSVSKNAKDILGFAPSYFVENEHGWSNRIHPEDREKVFKQFKEVLNEGGGGSAISEYRFKRKDGTYIWLRDELKLIEDTDQGHPLIYGSSFEITDRKKAEQALKESKTEELQREIERRKQAEEKLRKRLLYKKAISRCSNLLLEDTSDERLQESLDILLKVTGVDRVFLYKNVEIDGDLCLEPKMETTAEDIDSVLDKKRRYKYSDVPWWHKKLSNHEMISAHLEELPEPTRTALEKLDVQSVLVSPITVNQEWYGYIGFSNVHQKRDWEDFEVSLLKTAADIIAAFEKRKQIEDSLIEQRNYTETILNSLPSIYLLMDEDLEYIQWNNNAERYTGYSGEELAQKNAYDLIVPEEHEKLTEATQEIRKNRGTGTELTMLTKSGNEVPYYWRGYYIEIKQQKYFLCVGIDITQQKKTEQKLLEEKRFNEALLESLPGVFYMFDEDGNYERWNQNLLDKSGYTEDEIEQMHPSDLFDDQEYDEVEKEIKEVFKTGNSEVEASLLTKDGNKIPYYFTGQLFNIDEKDYLIGVGHDISEQKKAREKLKRSEELFRNLFLQAPAAIVMVGPQNSIKYVNSSFEDLFGYTEDELQGKDIDEVLVPEDEMDEAPKMPDTNYSMDSFHKEAQRLTKDGTLVDVFVAGIPVYMDGEPIAGFGMYIDITEQKKYEEEIYTSLKEKHVLLQEIHHRVKNNLAVVSGLIQLQMYETDDKVVRETLQESESRIQTMALIHEKLYKSQNLSRISCQSYIGDLVETIRSTNDMPKEITVHKDIDDIQLGINKAVPFALLINEVVTNAFKHAFKNREKGEIHIKLQSNGDQLEAEVRDDGIGLPDDLDPEHQDSLGMKLIHNFMRQLDAEGQLGSDNGTYLELSFDIEDVNGSSASGLIDL